MFDKEFENVYVYNTRVANGKALIVKWHPDKVEKICNFIGDYNLAVLGSISDDVVSKTGLDTMAQIVKLINQYSTKKIQAKKDPKTLKHNAIILLKKWNPDDYDDIASQLTDEELIKLAEVDSKLINAYGLNTVMDIKTCIKLNESGKTNGMKVNLYNGNYKEFLYNTYISHRKIRDGEIDTNIGADNFDYDFFSVLMENMIDVYTKYHNK